MLLPFPFFRTKDEYVWEKEHNLIVPKKLSCKTHVLRIPNVIAILCFLYILAVVLSYSHYHTRSNFDVKDVRSSVHDVPFCGLLAVPLQQQPF